MSDLNIIKINDLEFPERKVWHKTFGCQMNYHDSERILAYLKDLNFSSCDSVEDADLVLFNTCAIRDLANKKFYSQLGEIKHLKEKKASLKVGICGCVSQTEGQELIKKYRHLDFAFGTDVIDKINEIIYRLYKTNERFFVLDWDHADEYSIETKITHGSPQAFVNIIKGCNNFCSYCIVPFTRGREKSRTISEIVLDVQNLVSNHGITEVTLLGQNVNSFGKERDESLAKLLYKLDEIDGLKLIRYTTSHPCDLSDELIEAHQKVKKLANHLHLPVQSGSNSVLKRMKRKHSIEHYFVLLEKLRKANPKLVISSDIIVGFPNETQEEYLDTIKLLDIACFDFIYSYQFSPRKGTAAYNMEDRLPKEEKRKRLIELQKHQLEIQAKLRVKMVGETFRVLVEDFDIKTKKYSGRSSCNRIIHFSAPNDLDLKWKWVDVEVISATALSSQGMLYQIH